MKLHILSDLHNEISPFLIDPNSHSADVIVLAGDISKGDRGIAWARGQWPTKQIIYVAGNHEFYGQIRKNVISSIRLAAKQYDVHFLDDDEVIIDRVRFVGGTLWTDFKLFGDHLQKDCMRKAINGLNDFRVINEGDKVFSPNDALALFEKSYGYLKQRLTCAPFNGKTVVVTHHLPSELSIADRFKDDPLSACFASNTDDLLGHNELWIHGHTHDSFDYMVDGTRVVCNPRGYSFSKNSVENLEFNPALIVEI
jgi:predicted phosphodiesterase